MSSSLSTLAALLERERARRLLIKTEVADGMRASMVDGRRCRERKSLARAGQVLVFGGHVFEFRPKRVATRRSARDKTIVTM